MNHTNSIEQRKQIFLQHCYSSHGNKYDYSKVIYNRAQEKVEIICKVEGHGSFWQSPDAHRRGIGCPLCGRAKCKPTSFSTKLTQEQFLDQCKIHHGNTYDYSKTVYINKISNVIITCKEHGDFAQKAENHKNGTGCPKCGIKKAHNHFRSSTEEFIKKAKKVHGELYSYSNSQYLGKEKPITITCNTHGDFVLDKAHYHYLGHKQGCPKCSMAGTSLQEQSLASFIESLGFEILVGDRTIIKPLELDIVIPSLNIAIEYNGLYWHSEQAGKDKNYHLNKLELANATGYRLIQIFEDEWINKRLIVESRLRHILGKDTSIRKFARKLTVSDVTSKEANAFFDTHHIQGGCSASTYYGLFEGAELVACISFGINRFTKENGIELIRYATSYNVVGGFSKLMKHFQRQYPEIKVLTSYSDRRWSEGNVYEKNGFTLAGISQPSYFYANSEGIRYNRVLFQKHKLEGKLTTFDPSKTEVENVIANGYFRVFDCGTHKWVLELN